MMDADKKRQIGQDGVTTGTGEAGTPAARRSTLPAIHFPLRETHPSSFLRSERLRPSAALSGFVLRLSSFILHPSSFILLLGLVAIAPLLQPGYFWGAHDARHDVYFLFQYDRSVLEGNWFPRWGPDWAFGYGYPFWIIYAPLGILTGEVFHHFGGLGWEDSVKAVLALSMLVAGLGMYGFVRSWLGRSAALVAAAAYMVFPYHLVDMYVRAALPESLALALFPLVLWAFRETVVRPRLLAVLAAGLAYASLMWSHNLSAVLFTPGLAVYVLVLLWWRNSEDRRKDSLSARRASFFQPGPLSPHSEAEWAGPGLATNNTFVRAFLRRALAPALAAALGLGLSAGFFVPAILEARNVNQTQWFGQYYNPFQHFVYFNQLFNPLWGFGISQPGPDDVAQGSLSYQLGAAPVLLALVALATAGRLGRRDRRELWLWAAWGSVAIFLTLGISAAAWRLPLVPLAQFPWRYLMLAAAPISVLAGSLLAQPGDPLPTAPALPAARYASHASRITPAAAASRITDHGSRSTQSVSWPAALLVALVLLSSYPYLKVELREPTAEQGPVSYQALMRFQRTSDEMTGVTAWVDPDLRPHWSPMADTWINGGQVTTRVDYGQGPGQVPQNSTLAVNAEGMGSDREQVWYHADADGQSIRFNRFWYPGWKAYLLDGKDGRITRELRVEREDDPLARVVIPVPAGESYLLLRFEDTPLRAAARYITYATMAIMALAAIYALARQIAASRLPLATESRLRS